MGSLRFLVSSLVAVMLLGALGVRADEGDTGAKDKTDSKAKPVEKAQPKKERSQIDARFEDEVKPILASHCYSCHGEKKKKGDLDLARFLVGEQAAQSVQLWEKVEERVNAHEMPPEGSRQLNDNERAAILRWIRRLPRDPQADCSKLATDKTQNFYKGYVMSRRLNRAEYNNAVRDLVGLDLKPGDIFPADGSGGEGFDNNGDALFTSPILMEKYLEAADAALGVVLHDGKTAGGQAKGGDETARALPGGASAGGASANLTPLQIEVARQRILFVKPSDKLKPRDAAKMVVAQFGRRAFRRPVETTEIERLLTMFDKAQARGDSFEASVRLALKAVLISPNFLFLVEPEPEREGVYRLGHYPLASRLSFFLWASLPDDELMSLAEAGKLHDKDALKQQVRRMLKDPRAKALGESFAIQWLGLEPLGTTVKPDAKKFPQYDAALERAMRDEAALLFHDIVSNDRSLVTLLDADFTFMNERLAAHYGITGVSGEAMRRVALTDRNRGGVLGLAGVHTVTSYPLRTSPVLRGKWVLEEILGSKVPPPPPNVPSLPPDDEKHEGLSFRQQLELHRKNPECASCHQRMDPLGFGLENFDPIGRWRSDLAGQKIDAAGTLPNGEKFSGPAELRAVLLRQKDEVIRNLSRKMLGYALGRSLNKFDQCVIDDAMKALKANEYKATALIETIVLSYPFQYRFAKK